MTATASFAGAETKTLVAGTPGKIIRVRRLIVSSNGVSSYSLTLKSDDVPISPTLRPVNHLDLVFGDGRECFQTAAGDPLRATTAGSSAAASLWLDFDLVPA